MTTTDTREEIVSAAEVLFARDGYAATSLRHITEAAGVNLAAVNYHFGSKEALLVEILDRMVLPLTRRRLELLDELEEEGTPDVRRILAAFLGPDLELIAELRSRDPVVPRFMARMYTEGSGLMSEVTARQFYDNNRRFNAAFSRVLPDLPPRRSTGGCIAWSGW